jgi:acid phosphatase type 7
MKEGRTVINHKTVAMCVALLLLVGVVAACSQGPQPDRSSTPPVSEPVNDQQKSVDGAVQVVAVGDIACAPGEPVTPVSCQQAATGELVRSLAPDGALALGDLQYETGSADDFAASFNPAWGDLLPLVHAVPGNHEYGTPGAAAYFDVVGQDPDPGWGLWDVGGWRIYLLNSNCGDVDCEAEATWLSADLEANPHACSAIAMHAPRFSSGPHHSDSTLQPFWQVAYDHQVDVAFAGHDHDYERFAPLNPDGGDDPAHGIASFVVGTGGRSFYEPADMVAGSAYFQNDAFGVLDLELRPDRLTWSFRSIDGTTLDAGETACH